MKEKIEYISSELTELAEKKELEITDIIIDVPPIITMFENGFAELKEIVSGYTFPSPKEEIHFFKETKPQLFSKLIYYHKIYQLELNRPIANYPTLKAYLNKELEPLLSR